MTWLLSVQFCFLKMQEHFDLQPVGVGKNEEV